MRIHINRETGEYVTRVLTRSLGCVTRRNYQRQDLTGLRSLNDVRSLSRDVHEPGSDSSHLDFGHIALKFEGFVNFTELSELRVSGRVAGVRQLSVAVSGDKGRRRKR